MRSSKSGQEKSGQEKSGQEKSGQEKSGQEKSGLDRAQASISAANRRRSTLPFRFTGSASRWW
jgi:hypothetical protein